MHWMWEPERPRPRSLLLSAVRDTPTAAGHPPGTSTCNGTDGLSADCHTPGGSNRRSLRTLPYHLISWTWGHPVNPLGVRIGLQAFAQGCWKRTDFKHGRLHPALWRGKGSTTHENPVPLSIHVRYNDACLLLMDQVQSTWAIVALHSSTGT
ncbi:hypothetical protein J3E74DRAFT_472704 [Bipolaris maydis]|nr:hypothetical protein J3E74DRAFT_472704 [Bipolaris maydis]